MGWGKSWGSARRVSLVADKNGGGWTRLDREGGEGRNLQTTDGESRLIDHRNEYAGFSLGECGGEFD